jgi:hypothetical protein
MSSPTYRAMGKQVLREDATGTHNFAVAFSPDAARAVATILNADEVEHAPGTPDAELAHMKGVLWDD